MMPLRCQRRRDPVFSGWRCDYCKSRWMQDRDRPASWRPPQCRRRKLVAVLATWLSFGLALLFMAITIRAVTN